MDRVPSVPRLAALGLQHVLAFYAGAVIVPLLIAQSLKLDGPTTVHLINADLLTCGLATLIQAVGLGPKVGVRLPIVQGVTTTAVAPIIAIGLGATHGAGGVAALPMVYGAVIVSGLFTFFAAPLFVKLLKFFPPVVTGTVLLVMGTSLLSVSAADAVDHAQGVPDPRDLAYALGTLAVIILVQRFFRGFLGTLSVLIGLVSGTLVALVLGDAHLGEVARAGAFGITTPFYFGVPQFSFSAVLMMVLVMLITMVETTGDVFATGEIVRKRIGAADVKAAIRADGVSTTLGGVLNSFPYTCFAQNVGLVRLTGVKSRWVAAAAAVFMLVLGLLPKAGAVVASIPSPVLGAASLALFANVAWVGLQTIGKADLSDHRNSVIVTTALGLAMLVTFKPQIAQALPGWAQVFVSSGMITGAITAIVLNVLFFHVGRNVGAEVARTAEGRALTLDEVNALDREEFVRVLCPLFNEQTWPLADAWESRPFASTDDLRQAVQTAVLTAPEEVREALIADYPDMAQLLLSSDRERREISRDRGSLGIDEIDDVQAGQLQEVAAAYRKKFGMPFVAYLSTTDTVERVLAQGARRMANSPVQEHRVALSEIVEIANDRFDMILADANPVRAEWERRYTEAE